MTDQVWGYKDGVNKFLEESGGGSSSYVPGTDWCGFTLLAPGFTPWAQWNVGPVKGTEFGSLSGDGRTFTFDKAIAVQFQVEVWVSSPDIADTCAIGFEGNLISNPNALLGFMEDDYDVQCRGQGAPNYQGRQLIVCGPFPVAINDTLGLQVSFGTNMTDAGTQWEIIRVG